jgi:nucleoside-diphosphate-sugar epimerase
MLEHQSAASRKPDRVVVIGAGGFVGRAITRRLQAQNIDVLPLTRRELDLLQPDAVTNFKRLLQPTDSVVMVSARAPAKTVANLVENLRMVEPVCDTLAAVPIAHLLYVSSDAIYADDAHPVTETSPAAPSTIHGMMHAARELMLKSSARGPVACLRPTLIYGVDDPHSGYGPNRFRREAAKGGPVQIFGEGEERRDHIVIGDVAELASLILHRRSAGALNAVTGVSTSFRDIAHMIAACFGSQIQVVSLPRSGPPPHLTHRHFDITACHKAFPNFRFTPLTEGLDRAARADQGS